MAALEYPMTKITLGNKQFVAGLGDSFASMFMPRDTEMNIFARLRNNTWGAGDVIGVIKAGLLGSGHSMDEVDSIIKTHVTSKALAQSAPAAMLILGAYLIGLDTEGA